MGESVNGDLGAIFAKEIDIIQTLVSVRKTFIGQTGTEVSGRTCGGEMQKNPRVSNW